jgi:hypothetical protein
MHPTEFYKFKDYPGECLWYLSGWVLPFHVLVFLLGCVVFGVLAWMHRGSFFKRVVRLGSFISLLLVFGALFNGLWSCLVFGHLYYSADYVSDYTPFWPITRGIIDFQFGETRGQLFGVSLLQLNLVWFLFALGNWGLVVGSYSLIFKGMNRMRTRVPPGVKRGIALLILGIGAIFATFMSVRLPLQYRFEWQDARVHNIMMDSSFIAIWTLFSLAWVVIAAMLWCGFLRMVARTRKLDVPQPGN